MTSSVPIVRQIAWLSVVPQLGILLVLIAIARLLGVRDAVLAGAIAYVVASIMLRFGVARHHRRGVSLFKKERFSEAVPHFFRSYDFFVKYSWLDRWRSVTLLSSSRISYTEMALLNAAFCLAQSGERDRSIQEYKRVLDQFPGSKMAEAALRLLEPKDPDAQQSVAADRREVTPPAER
jgi:tetratricopeptide (TPR) repeat protein